MATFLLIAVLTHGGIAPAVILGAGSAYWLSDAKREATYRAPIAETTRRQQPEHG